MTEYRIERDTMGEVHVPSHALWGAQTQRAVENFPVSGRPLPYALITALAQIKEAAAKEGKVKPADAHAKATDKSRFEPLLSAEEKSAAA